MKKSIKNVLLLFIVTVMILPCVKSQNENNGKKSTSLSGRAYNAAVGGILYGAGAGATFKMPIAEKCYVEVDLTASAGLSLKTFKMERAIVEVNPSVMFQNKIKELINSDLYWFVGGGISVGYEMLYSCGKIGTNALIGLEFVHQTIPFSFQLDLRPGYGMLFNPDYVSNVREGGPKKMPHHLFDLMIGLSFKYTFRR